MGTSSLLEDFFVSLANDLKCERETQTYIISILVQNKNAEHDLSKESLTLIYSDAFFNQDFGKFQNIGDYVFFINSIFPQYFQAASEQYYIHLGQLSYYQCYKILQRKWKLYEEIADRLPELTEELRNKLIIAQNNK
jgi:hypothetical protein